MRKKFSCSLRARPNKKKSVFWVTGLKILGTVGHRSLKFDPYITSIASKPKAHNVIM